MKKKRMKEVDYLPRSELEALRKAEKKTKKP